MKHFKFGVIFFLSLFFSLESLSQDTLKKESTARKIITKIFVDTVTSTSTHGYIINPLFYYTPETRFAFGISTVFYFRMSKKDSAYRPSVVHPFFGVTQNKQVFVESPFQLFFQQEKYYLYGEVSAYDYPYFFFGVGNGIPHSYNEIYTALYPSCTLSVLKKVAPPLYAGFRMQVDDYNIVKKETGGMLDQNLVQGSNGGLNAGIGPMLLYDTRNNIFSPTKGAYVELATWLNSKYTFSDYTYGSYVLDARKYVPWHKNDMFGFQFYGNLMTGNPPFYQMAMLGGTKRMRGYYEGRYRDKDYLSAQAEYRSGFWRNRLGYAVFAGTGFVFHDFKNIDLMYLKPSAGAGLRIRFDRKEKINFRIDFAFGYKTFYPYFVLSEAF
ncbi:MAG: BamA/TamA family outer membrane protein [Cytophagaceae bacterium]